MTQNNFSNSETPAGITPLIENSEGNSTQSLEGTIRNSSVARSVGWVGGIYSSEDPAPLYLLPPASLLVSPPCDEVDIDISEYAKEAQRLEAWLKRKTINVKVSLLGTFTSTVLYEIGLPDGLDSWHVRRFKREIMSSFQYSPYRFIKELETEECMILEVPKKLSLAQPVYLKSLIDSKGFAKCSSTGLAAAFGKNANGETAVFDLSLSPHVLVHGPVASGKSVAIRAMLLSMLCTNTPEHLRLIIVDTKIVEYADFDGIPHLCQPVCAGVDSAMRSLAWLASEIERRGNSENALDMHTLRILHKRMFGRYRRGKPIKLPPGTHEILPDIVVVIDEFSDLLHFYGKEAEELLVKIMIRGSWVGVQVILTTSIINRKEIPFSIRSCCYSIICFQGPGSSTAKEILGRNSTEKLSRPGDMLCCILGLPLLRVQGARVSMNEVIRVTDFWKSHC